MQTLLLEIVPEICIYLPCLPEVRLLMTTKRLAEHAAKNKKARRLAVLRAFDSIIAHERDFPVETEGSDFETYSTMTYIEQDKVVEMEQVAKYNRTGRHVFVELEWREDFLIVHIRSSTSVGCHSTGFEHSACIIYPHKGTIRERGRNSVEKPMEADLFHILDSMLSVGV